MAGIKYKQKQGFEFIKLFSNTSTIKLTVRNLERLEFRIPKFIDLHGMLI